LLKVSIPDEIRTIALRPVTGRICPREKIIASYRFVSDSSGSTELKEEGVERLMVLRKVGDFLDSVVIFPDCKSVSSRELVHQMLASS
jgi:hypothetical protein